MIEKVKGKLVGATAYANNDGVNGLSTVQAFSEISQALSSWSTLWLH